MINHTTVEEKRIDRLLKKYPDRKGVLISLLQDIQAEDNWLSGNILRATAKTLNLPLRDVYGVATFFKAFSLKPRGKHMVTACLGTACHVRGAPRIVDELQSHLSIPPGETTPDKMVTLETVNCLGACAMGPIVVIDGVYHSHTTKSDVRILLDKIMKNSGTRKKHHAENKKSKRS